MKMKAPNQLAIQEWMTVEKGLTWKELTRKEWSGVTLNLLFATITVSIKRSRKSLDQELDVVRKKGLIESNQYKQSFYIHH